MYAFTEARGAAAGRAAGGPGALGRGAGPPGHRVPAPPPPPPGWAGAALVTARTAQRPSPPPAAGVRGGIPGRAPGADDRTPRPSRPIRELLAPPRRDRSPGGPKGACKKANRNHAAARRDAQPAGLSPGRGKEKPASRERAREVPRVWICRARDIAILESSEVLRSPDSRRRERTSRTRNWHPAGATARRPGAPPPLTSPPSSGAAGRWVSGLARPGAQRRSAGIAQARRSRVGCAGRGPRGAGLGWAEGPGAAPSIGLKGSRRHQRRRWEAPHSPRSARLPFLPFPRCPARGAGRPPGRWGRTCSSGPEDPSLLCGGASPATLPSPTTVDPTQSDQVWTWETNCPAARAPRYEGKRSSRGLAVRAFLPSGLLQD